MKSSRMVEYYMDLARRTAEQSRAIKLQVGAVIVTQDDAILYGWNGTPTSWDNVCETKNYATVAAGISMSTDEIKTLFPFEDELGRYCLQTKPEVLHAEMNALSKLAKSTLSGRGASLFLTHSPCIHCAKAVYQSGIENVFYLEDYRCDDGVLFLKQCGVNIQRVE